MRKKTNSSVVKLSSTQEKRLKFIEYLVYFQGTVAREDIKNKFRVSPASSTNDFSMYEKLAPDNIIYNVRLKCYEISDSFVPLFGYQTITDRLPIYSLPKLNKPADASTIDRVALIARAIQREKSLNIIYFSASSGKTERQVVPVAFADNLLRWHLRAYDRERGKFSDFVINRIKLAEIIKDDIIQPHEHQSKDIQWHSSVELKIVPHSQNLANAEFFMAGNEKSYSVNVRAAMAGYFLELWNVDCSPDANLIGKQYQYALSNLGEVAVAADLTLAPGYKNME